MNEVVRKCEQCEAFKQMNPKGGQCRANPPQVLVFGMEQVQVAGLQGGNKGMRPLTGIGFPDVPVDGWCMKFSARPDPGEDTAKALRSLAQREKLVSTFDPSKLKPIGEAAPTKRDGFNGHDAVGED